MEGSEGGVEGSRLINSFSPTYPRFLEEDVKPRVKSFRYVE